MSPYTPSSRGKLAIRSSEELSVNPVENRIIHCEGTSEWHTAQEHVVEVLRCQIHRVLLRGIIPFNVVQVVVHSRVLVVFVVADNGVKVALGGGQDIRVVHQKSAGETVPTPDAELEEWPRENDPFRPCKFTNRSVIGSLSILL